MTRLRCVASCILAVGAGLEAVAAQGVIRERRCYRLSYDSAQHGASSGLFPASVMLLPGDQRGDLRINDTVRFHYYRPPSGGANWYSKTGELWSFLIEAGETGVSYTLRPRGDSLVGSAVYRTDAVRPDEPTMRAEAVRVPCADRG